MASHYHDLPDELVEEIFRRLPGKSLGRFKSLSKLWSSRISTLKFKTKTAVLLPEKPYYRSVDAGEDEAGFEELPIPLEISKDLERPHRIAGSCNGLLLMVSEHCYFVSFSLWNPFTQCYTKVLDHEVNVFHEYDKTFGFWYDACANDYMVALGLVANEILLGPFLENKKFGFVAVCSLKNKCFKEVRQYYNGGSIIEGPFLEGHLHWGINDNDLDPNRDELRRPNTIEKYDPITNKLDKVAMPQSKGEGDIRIVGLSVLNGCLCVVFVDPYNKLDFEVMIMTEYGVVESWTTLFVMSNFANDARSLKPLYCTRKGEVLLQAVYNEDVDVVVYNPVQKSYRKFELYNVVSTGVATYEQTLISPAHMKMTTQTPKKMIDFYFETEEHDLQFRTS